MNFLIWEVNFSTCGCAAISGVSEGNFLWRIILSLIITVIFKWQNDFIPEVVMCLSKKT